MEFYDFITLTFSFIAIIFSVFTFFQNVVHDRKVNTLNAFNLLQEQCFDKLKKHRGRFSVLINIDFCKHRGRFSVLINIDFCKEGF